MIAPAPQLSLDEQRALPGARIATMSKQSLQVIAPPPSLSRVSTLPPWPEHDQPGHARTQPPSRSRRAARSASRQSPRQLRCYSRRPSRSLRCARHKRWKRQSKWKRRRQEQRQPAFGLVRRQSGCEELGRLHCQSAPDRKRAPAAHGQSGRSNPRTAASSRT